MATREDTDDIRIGWIGLGEMGYGMAKNLHNYLASHGSRLTVWNRSPEKTDAIYEQGAAVASSIGSLASTCNVIFTSLSNDAAVENVYEQLLQVAGKNQEQTIFVDTSTIHPTTATKICQLVSAYPQHRYLQCPVFGRPDRAHAGQLVWVASGDAAAIGKLQPYFASMSKNTIDLKTTDVAKASSFKLLGNFFVVGSVELLAEGFALAEKIDIDKNAVLGFIETFFPTPSWIGYSQKMATGSTDKAGGFPVELGLKDVGHMRKLAADHGATLPTADLAYGHLEKLKAQGKGDQDWSSIVDILREGPSSQ
ncbi:MAG: NAD binding domain of 6-phosphogluconate dehydrogenase-domain-containing protein [Linnemannia gamsii]|nr:MAG: NAD binding domain of 6-phosphogluconate dehydrogenase-domain-containing protein [Linnemannia gamsii]